MKILMVNKFHHLTGGSERYCFDLTDLLEERGHTVIPFSMAHPANRPGPYAPFFVRQQSYDDLLKASLWRQALAAFRSFYSLEAKKKAHALVAKTRPEAAHLHLIQHQLTPSVLTALCEARIPSVMTLHEYQLLCPNYKLFSKSAPCQKCRGGRYYHALLRRCVKDSRAASLLAMIEHYWQRLWPVYRKGVFCFIAPSRFMAETMVSWGWPAKQVETIPHPIRLPPPALPLTGTPYALYMGRLAPEKGLITLLSALEKAGDVRLWIAGDGEMRPLLERKAEALGGRVRFLGFLEGEPLSRVLAGARFVVVPSEWYEVFGLVLGEAFAYKKAVVGSRIGAIPELVRHEETGLLFTPGHADELAYRMEYLWRHPKEAETMGRAGHEAIKTLCDPDQHCNRILNLYRAAADERRDTS